MYFTHFGCRAQEGNRNWITIPESWPSSFCSERCFMLEPYDFQYALAVDKKSGDAFFFFNTKLYLFAF